MVKIGEGGFIAENATIKGDVEIGNNVTIMYNAVLRGDVQSITIGDESNVQDGCIIHGEQPTILGKRVSLGHGVIIHGAEIGANSLIAAGALITKGKKYPPNSLIMGSPAVAKRELKPEELESVSFNADLYLAIGKKHREDLWDISTDDIIAEMKKEK